MKFKLLLPIITALVVTLFVYMLLGGEHLNVATWQGGAEKDPEKSLDLGSNPDKVVPSSPQIKSPEVNEVTIDNPEQISSIESAQTTLDKMTENMGLGKNVQLTVSGSTTDSDGNVFFQVSQTYKGVPVYGASSLVIKEGQNSAKLYGHWQSLEDISIEPKFSAKEALRLALSNRGVPEEREINILAEGQLSILVLEGRNRLCWNFSASLTNPNQEPLAYLVDANEPVIYLESELIAE